VLAGCDKIHQYSIGSITSVTGEIYATRNSTAIDWTNISCARHSIYKCRGRLHEYDADSPDTINKTFQ